MIRPVSIPTVTIPPHGYSALFATGSPLETARAAVVMIHGRGASAEGILDLAQYFNQKEVIFIAPQAVGNVWYPYSFMTPEKNNEPGLSSGLQRISGVVDHLVESGIPLQKIMLLGFSQGACLALEWTARQRKPLSAVFGLSGGLIGETINPLKYSGNMEKTTVFLGCSDNDFHIPKQRVIESAGMFEILKAEVTLKLYTNMGHTINQDEIDFITGHIETVLREH